MSSPDRGMMVEHNFTLIIDGDVDAKLDALFEAGCDDATFGAVDGTYYAVFDREAPTFDMAVSSAISDIESVSGLQVRHGTTARLERLEA